MRRLLPIFLIASCSTTDDPSPYGDRRPGGDRVTGGDPVSGDPSSGDPSGGDPTPGDPGGTGMWDACPTAAAYVGDTWGLTLDVTTDAFYCNQGDESQTLAAEFLRKTMMRIAPGSFAIPDDSISTAVPFTLPICFAFGEGEAPVLDGTGEVTANFSPGTGGDWFYISMRQPLIAGSQPYDLRLDLIGLRETAQTVVVADGAMKSDDFGFGLVSGQLCHGTDCWSSADEFRTISACDYSALPVQLHHIEFTDGSTTGVLDLDIHMGSSPASTEPALFVLGEGNIGGVIFSQDDFWQLFYRPTHHHFTRDFGVIFDTPIGGACGIAVYDVDPYSGIGSSTIHTTDCDLNHLPTSWTITDSTWTP